LLSMHAASHEPGTIADTRGSWGDVSRSSIR
jgi:hypothetical protein